MTKTGWELVWFIVSSFGFAFGGTLLIYIAYRVLFGSDDDEGPEPNMHQRDVVQDDMEW